MKKTCVEFKGTKNGVVIYCLEEFSFPEILAGLAKSLQLRASFFADAEVRVDIGTRKISESEKKELADVIAENSRLRLVGIQSKKEKPNITIASFSPKQRAGEYEKEGFKEGRSLIIKRTLRSGQKIFFPGSVTVMGDVNPGAQIVAESDIFVFGTLRGYAHAGAAGDRSASVTALCLAPTQLRIADVISRSPDDDTSLPDSPECAQISNGQIVINTVTAKQSS